MTETEEWRKMESVDARLEEMKAGEEYQKADLTQKREMTEAVLDELEREGLIREISCLAENGFFVLNMLMEYWAASRRRMRGKLQAKSR